MRAGGSSTTAAVDFALAGRKCPVGKARGVNGDVDDLLDELLHEHERGRLVERSFGTRAAVPSRARARRPTAKAPASARRTVRAAAARRSCGRRRRQKAPGRAGRGFPRSAASSAARRRRARWTTARSASARRGRRGRRRRRRTTRSRICRHMLQPRTSPAAAGEEAAARGARPSSAGRKSDSATSVGSVEEEVKEVLGIPGRMPGPQGGSFGSASGGRRRAARVARAREVGDHKLVGALVRDGVEPVVVAQRVDHDPADRLRHPVGTGSQPGSYLSSPGSWGALPRVGSCASDRYSSSTNLNSNNASSIGWSNPSSNHASCSCLHPQWGGSGADDRPSVRGDDSYALPAYQRRHNESFRGSSSTCLSFHGPGATATTTTTRCQSTSRRRARASTRRSAPGVARRGDAAKG